VPDHEHPCGITFGRIASTIAVRDLPRALAFYVGIMGMHVTFENGDPVGFASSNGTQRNCISPSPGTIGLAPRTLPTSW
jgi:catechol 2,3-dioxygenase-like lactoylglutathione lyase family enzyme